MDIAKIKGLDVGVSGLLAKGRVGYAGQPKNITGDNYDFWKQFITLEDSTGTMGVWVSAKDKFRLKKGDTVTIEKGQLDSYVKDGKQQVSLNGRLANLSENKATQASSEITKPENNRDKLIVAQVVYKELSAKFSDPNEFDLWLMKNLPVIIRHTGLLMRIAEGKNSPAPQAESDAPELDHIPNKGRTFEEGDPF